MINCRVNNTSTVSACRSLGNNNNKKKKTVNRQKQNIIAKRTRNVTLFFERALYRVGQSHPYFTSDSETVLVSSSGLCLLGKELRVSQLCEQLLQPKVASTVVCSHQFRMQILFEFYQRFIHG